MKIITNKKGYCHYDNKPEVNYYDQPGRFIGGASYMHKVTLKWDDLDKENTYYIKCRDFSYNIMEDDYVITLES